MDHDTLVARAITWLRGQQCPLVLAGMASCNEIPDAIGFKTSHTIVVECKTSKADFHRDRAKYKYFVNEHGHKCYLKAPLQWRKGFEGCPIETAPNMGTERYYLCEPDVITKEMVQEHHPDHGLLHINGRKVMRILPAPHRAERVRDTASEVKYLQYAMRHLLGNLGASGVTVDVIKAAKMFGHGSIKIADWKAEKETTHHATDTGTV